MTWKANLLQWFRGQWGMGSVENETQCIASGRWTELEYRMKTLFIAASRLQAEGLAWEQIEKVLVLSIDLAGICGEDQLQ